MNETEETFLSHLIEMRDRLLRAVLGVVLVFGCLFPWAQDVYQILAKPLLAAMPAGGTLIATAVVSSFFVPVKVTLMAAFLISLPWVFYQAWAFIAPGLYKHEKKLALPLIVSSTLLFFAGMAFAYFLVLPMVFHFVIGFAPAGVAVTPDISEYFDFVLTLFLAFGVTFEVPVAVVLLVKMGMVSVEKLRDIRPYIVVGAFVIGAIFTPPDAISQFMLAIPLWVLYELGILVGAAITRERYEDELESDYEPMTEAQMDAELDRIEAEDRSARK